jgi:hypothetical protein
VLGLGVLTGLASQANLCKRTLLETVAFLVERAHRAEIIVIEGEIIRDEWSNCKEEVVRWLSTLTD